MEDSPVGTVAFTTRGAIRVFVLNTTTSDPRAGSVVKTTPVKNKAITHKWHMSPGERMG